MTTHELRPPTLVARVRRQARVVNRRLSAGDGTFDRPPASDVVLAAGVLVASVASFVLEPRNPTTPADAPLWLGFLLIVVICLPLAWRRVLPLATIAVSGTATGIMGVLGYSIGLGLAAVLIALYSVTAFGTKADGRWSLAISLGFIVAAFVGVEMRGGEVRLVEVTGNLSVFLGIWALGDRTRARRQVLAQLTARATEAERSRELAAQLAVADERRVIARELHDVIAHAVSVVVVQAGAGQRVAERDPRAARDALSAIEGTGRDALGELRRLVGVLRDDAVVDDRRDPQPTLADVRELVGRLADAGVPARLDEVGRGRELPQGLELSAFRIVQEALTNVLRHAGEVTDVVVRIEHRPDLLVVEVRDDGTGAPAEPAPAEPHGSGIVGMRERAAMLDGTLRAARRRDGGFAVRAKLPVPAEHPVGRPPRAAVTAPEEVGP